MKTTKWRIFVLLTLVALLADCRGGGTGGQGKAVDPAPWLQDVDWTAATQESVSTTPQRLLDDLPRAASRLGWALVRRHHNPQAGPGEPILVVEMLLPSERRLYAAAFVEDQGGEADPGEQRKYRLSAVAARVDNPLLQQRYLKTLEQVLAGDPKPQRGGKFQLP